MKRFSSFREKDCFLNVLLRHPPQESESLYGGEQNLITINMSEFQERRVLSDCQAAP